MNHGAGESRRAATLVIGALGIVYGDIGTSPLYALKECFHGDHGIKPNPENVMGVLSLILWALTLIVSIKYLAFVMRANNRGEGGILALMALAFPNRVNPTAWRATGLALGVFGAALLYGDGMITPAISVLSAVEGLNITTKFFEPYVVGITIAILIGLFAVQRVGTARVGIIFGPIMILWFSTIAVMGVGGILKAPEVVAAFNPWRGIHFLLQNGSVGFVVLGSVFLVVTGGEALYADMGHFGPSPIRKAWYYGVFPALVLNYLGQGALLLHNPEAAENPFFYLAPRWSLYPLVGLATIATVIASQALISGTFSLTMQAVQLGYLPRISILHTSSDQRGQIYIPHVNWTLMVACIGLVIGFGSSDRLAAAYGIAVTLTMIITTILFSIAARRLWNWGWLHTIFICGISLTVESAFCAANMLKVAHGGWFPLLVGALVFTVMITWQQGRRSLGERLRSSVLPLPAFLESMQRSRLARVPGTAIFMSGNPDGTPLALLHNVKHNKVLHERVVILNIHTEDIARVDEVERVKVDKLGEGFYRITGRYGFMEEPNVPELLERCRAQGLECRPLETTYFLSNETIVPSSRSALPRWRARLFAILARNAQRATTFFRLPANRVVELGMQIEL